MHKAQNISKLISTSVFTHARFVANAGTNVGQWDKILAVHLAHYHLANVIDEEFCEDSPWNIEYIAYKTCAIVYRGSETVSVL